MTAFNEEFAGFEPLKRFGDAPRAQPPLRSTMPDPEEFAYHLTEVEHHALKTAWSSGIHGWRVATQYAEQLSREGLVQVRGPGLTAYGLAVRRIIMREDA